MKEKIILFLTIFSLILSSSVYAFCIDRSAPSAPASLVIHDSPYDTDGNMTLTWAAAVDGPCESSAVSYYNIYRSNDSTNFSMIGNTTTTSFDDISSLAEGVYYYHVTAVDNVVDSPHEGPAASGSTTVGQAPETPAAPSGGSPSGGSLISSGGGVASSTTTCTENWSCTEWSECVDGTRTRTCEDLNECNVNETTETQNCSVPEVPSPVNENAVAESSVAGTIASTGFFLLTPTNLLVVSVIGIIAAVIIVFLLRRKPEKIRLPSKSLL
jgi:hypothetical protein